MPWYVLQVAANRESYVAELLARKGLHGEAPVLGEGRAWVPHEFRYVRASRHAKGKTRPISVKLLPGYVFASVPEPEHWRDVAGERIAVSSLWGEVNRLADRSGARLVFGAITSEGRPAQVPEADMVALMHAAARFVPYTTAAAVRERLKVGEKVTVISRHHWAHGQAAEIAETGLRRVKAWLPMFGGMRLVEMPIEAFA